MRIAQLLSKLQNPLIAANDFDHIWDSVIDLFVSCLLSASECTVHFENAHVIFAVDRGIFLLNMLHQLGNKIS